MDIDRIEQEVDTRYLGFGYEYDCEQDHHLKHPEQVAHYLNEFLISRGIKKTSQKQIRKCTKLYSIIAYYLKSRMFKLSHMTTKKIWNT